MEKLAGFETVLRKSPLSEALLQRFPDDPSLSNVFSTWNPRNYHANDSLDSFPRDYNYFNPGREYSINGKILRTSDTLRDSTVQVKRFETIYDIPNAPKFTPQKVAFTGNALCGSACSTLTNFLIEYYNGTAVMQSSQPAQPIEVSQSLLLFL